MMTKDAGRMRESKTRIAMAKAAFSRMKVIFGRN
jgi:hypothetical protein